MFYFPYFNLYMPEFLVLYLESFSIAKFSIELPFYSDLQESIKDKLFPVEFYNLGTSNKKFEDQGDSLVLLFRH